MNEMITAGPACSAAAVPVTTKIPVPMTAPMPSAVMPHGPKVRLSPGPWVSSWVKSVFFASSWENISGFRKVQGRRLAGPRHHERSHHVVQRVGDPFRRELTAAIAVQAIEHQTDHCPNREYRFGDPAEVDEQQDATGDRQRTHDPYERRTERPRTIGLLPAQDHHADGHHREGEQG